jgi:hypothetical protein
MAQVMGVFPKKQILLAKKKREADIDLAVQNSPLIDGSFEFPAFREISARGCLN